MAFDTLKMIFNILAGKETKQEQVHPLTISLDELCQIWLPYNNSFRTEPPAETAQQAASPENPPVEKPADENAAPEVQPLPPEEAKPQPSVDPVVVAKRKIELNKFYDDVIQPCNEIMGNPAITGGINKVVELFEKYGDCPSVPQNDFDGDDIQYYRKLLGMVNVRDHSFRVTRLALRFLREEYSDPSAMQTVMIIASLCHDTGKMPEVRTLYGGGSTTEHSRVSVSVVDSIFSGVLHDHVLNMVKTMVDNHHKYTKDQLSLILKRADIEARQIEIVEQDKRLTAPDWDVWFNTKDFLDRVEKHVNVIQTGDMWRAFSVDKTVYCNPQFLYEEAAKMALDKQIIAVILMQKYDTDQGQKKIVESLKKAGITTEELGRHFVSRRYDISTEHHGSKKMNLVPIRITAFSDPEAINLLKDTRPEIIKGIKAC